MEQELEPMTFLEYREGALRTAMYPDHARVIYPVLKLAGEAGEAAGKMEQAVTTDEHQEELLKELGDVLWYAAVLSRDLELDEPWLSKELDTFPPRGTIARGPLSDTLFRLAKSATQPAEKLGKLIRDQGLAVGGDLTDEARAEFGEMLWKVMVDLTFAAQEAGSNLLAVAHMNLEKLASRHERGVITGSGDNR